MKNIAIFIPSLKPGGAEKQATLLATILANHYEVDMYLLYGDMQIAQHNSELLSESKVRVHRLSGTMFSKMVFLLKAWRARKVDVLFNYLTSCDVIGALVARLAGVRTTYSGIRNARMESSKIIAERFVHNYIAQGSIFNCYSGAEFFTSKGFNRSKNIIIPNCFYKIADPIYRTEKDIKHIVTVGRFVPQKDYETIIRTIGRLKDIRRDFVIDIVGYGPEEESIRGWIKAYYVEQFVNLHINPNNVQEIVRNADIYFCASLFEGTSNSIMEAMNWSLPVVATEVGDNSHLVIDHKSGFLHAIGDVEGMAGSIDALLSSSELRNQYGNLGNKHLREDYSVEVFEQRYIKLIEE